MPDAKKRRAPNFEYKAKLLSEGKPELLRSIKYRNYFDSMQNLDEYPYLPDCYIEYAKSLPQPRITRAAADNATALFSYDDLLECERINKATYNRNNRLHKRIREMLDDTNHNSIFLTFTFTDDTLSKTSPETRRRYVRRWLADNAFRYVANIDFGKTNDREHYHAIVSVDDKLDYMSWKYGALNGKRVRIDDDKSATRLTKYTNKLTNHAIKNTTKRNAIIYSRS